MMLLNVVSMLVNVFFWCMCVCVYACVYACVCVCSLSLSLSVFLSVATLCLFLSLSLSLCTLTSLKFLFPVCAALWFPAGLWWRSHTNIHDTHTHTHTHTHKHTQTHTHTHFPFRTDPLNKRHHFQANLYACGGKLKKREKQQT